MKLKKEIYKGKMNILYMKGREGGIKDLTLQGVRIGLLSQE